MPQHAPADRSHAPYNGVPAGRSAGKASGASLALIWKLNSQDKQSMDPDATLMVQ